MVKITIFIEGSTPPLNRDEPARVVDNTNVMRESFKKLLAQKIPEEKIDLNIEPSGGFWNTSESFKKAASKGATAIVLLDLDGPSHTRENRINELNLNDYQSQIFFMIQEMEAWVLAQPDKIEQFGQNEKLIRKQPEVSISSHNLLTRVAHPEEISNPKEALKAIFLQFFDWEKSMRDGRLRLKARAYSGVNDGPKLIALLDLERLMDTFPDTQSLVNWILGAP